MKSKTIRLLSAGVAVAALAFAMACEKNPQTPTGPSPTPGSPGAPTLVAPTPTSPIGGERTTVLKPSLSVRNAAATGSVGTVTYQFELSEMDSFPPNSRTSAASDVAQGDGVTSWQPPSNLIPNFLYYWHARATDGTIMTDWSNTETFRTP